MFQREHAQVLQPSLPSCVSLPFGILCFDPSTLAMLEGGGRNLNSAQEVGGATRQLVTFQAAQCC